MKMSFEFEGTPAQLAQQLREFVEALTAEQAVNKAPTVVLAPVAAAYTAPRQPEVVTYTPAPAAAPAPAAPAAPVSTVKAKAPADVAEKASTDVASLKLSDAIALAKSLNFDVAGMNKAQITTALDSLINGDGSIARDLRAEISPDTVVPRRGRPPKNRDASVAETPADDGSEPETDEAPTPPVVEAAPEKRKPGRPRKNPLPEVTPPAPVEEEAAEEEPPVVFPRPAARDVAPAPAPVKNVKTVDEDPYAGLDDDEPVVKPAPVVLRKAAAVVEPAQEDASEDDIAVDPKNIPDGLRTASNFRSAVHIAAAHYGIEDAEKLLSIILDLAPYSPKIQANVGGLSVPRIKSILATR